MWGRDIRRTLGGGSYELENVIGRCVKCLDWRNRNCLSVRLSPATCLGNIGLQYMWMMMNIMENISTRWIVDLLLYLNVTWTNIVANGLVIVNNCRILRVDFAGIIVYALVYFEVEVLVCYFTGSARLNNVTAHKPMRVTWINWCKCISCFVDKLPYT